MRKALVLTVFGLFLISMIGMASATTLIAGKIYDSDFSETVSGATVVVTCNGIDQTVTSESDGAYSVTYNEVGDINTNSVSTCSDGDELSVYAEHSSYGSNTVEGVIHNDMVLTWDVGIVNVPLVPEFGLVVGILTILSAVGVFFVVRRE